jgi:hypothetical protein
LTVPVAIKNTSGKKINEYSIADLERKFTGGATLDFHIT